METSSYTNTLMSVQARSAIGCMSKSVAEYFCQQNLLEILPVDLPIELPPIGIMTLNGKSKTPATIQLIEQLREIAQERTK